MAKLDLSGIFMTWVCPVCKELNQQLIEDIGFGFELDLTVGLDGHCSPWLEVDCPRCGSHLEKLLGKG